jgi:hypothetical protein
MLDMMLSNSTEGFSVGEVHALFRPYRPHHFKPICGCGDLECHIWENIRDQGEEQLYKTIFDKFQEVKYIVDSSKNPFWINKQMNALAKQGYDVYNILVWKTPIDFCSSMLKRNRKGCIKGWVNYYRLYLSLIENWIPISYKELANNPSQSLLNLCNILEIDHQIEMENYWKKQHHTLFGNDSAKIHLFNTKGELKIEDGAYSSNDMKSKDKMAHRSIYYNDDNQIVSDKLRKKIKSNKIIKEIIKDISSVSLSRELINKKYKYNFFELIIKKIISFVKRCSGNFIGKYFRIF